MTAVGLLAELRQRGASVAVVDGRLRIDAPKGAVTPELQRVLAAHKPELIRALSATFDPNMGEPAAVWLRDTVIGDVWLVADTETLAERPDIVRSGLPVIFFDEVDALSGKTPEELRALGVVKSVFPTARVLQ